MHVYKEFHFFHLQKPTFSFHLRVCQMWVFVLGGGPIKEVKYQKKKKM
jgi:hypothetical protein